MTVMSVRADEVREGDIILHDGGRDTVAYTRRWNRGWPCIRIVIPGQNLLELAPSKQVTVERAA